MELFQNFPFHSSTFPKTNHKSFPAHNRNKQSPAPMSTRDPLGLDIFRPEDLEAMQLHFTRSIWLSWGTISRRVVTEHLRNILMIYHCWNAAEMRLMQMSEILRDFHSKGKVWRLIQVAPRRLNQEGKKRSKWNKEIAVALLEDAKESPRNQFE